MKILANSCPKCGAPTNAIRDGSGKFVEIEPKEAEFLIVADVGGLDRARGYILHRSVCRAPKAAAAEKAEKPKRGSKRGLGKGMGELGASVPAAAGQ